MKIKALVFICFSLSFSVVGQVKDSIAQTLIIQIESETSDSLQIPLKIDLAQRLASFNVDTAKVVLFDVKNTIEQKKYNSLYYNKQKAEVLQNISDCYSIQNDLVEALSYQQKAIDLRVKINDSVGLGGSYYGSAHLFFKKNDTVSAKRYFKKALDIHKKYNSIQALTTTYLSMGVLYNKCKEKDSAVYFYEQAKKYDTSIDTKVTVDSNLATMFLKDGEYEKASTKFREVIGALKELNNYVGVSTIYLNLAVAQAQLKSYDTSLQAIDSALVYSKKLGSKELLMKQYYTRRSINTRKGDYKSAYEDFKLYKVYYDSINDVEEAKRYTELELNYKFEKEKELAAAQLENETFKKRLYLILFLVALVASLMIIRLVRKNNKQKLDLAEVDVLKADLALANREKELKQILVESSVRKNILRQTLDQVKEIIDLKDDTERRAALKSLSALLLSDKAEDTAASVLETYLDEVSVDFKVLLDIQYPMLTPKEKELLCLMKMGLSNTEISKLQNTSAVAIKSTRYRIRKKLQIDAKQDIIQYIEDTTKDV